MSARFNFHWARLPGGCFLVLFAGWVRGAELRATPTSVGSPPRSPRFPQTPLPPLPPVAEFNRLLRVSPDQRTNQLAGKSDAARTLILRELAAVDGMAARQREDRILQLRMAQLRYYLLPLMRTNRTERASLWSLVPLEDRVLLESRLTAWDALTVADQQEVLESEVALQLLVRQAVGRRLVGGSTNVVAVSIPTQVTKAWDAWQALTPAEQRRREEKLKQFIVLTTDEQTRVLGVLPDTERRRMELVLKQFTTLPPERRELCIRNFSQLSRLPEEARAEFLKNAAKWEAMSQSERDDWRRLVLSAPPLPSSPSAVVALPAAE